MDGHPGKGPSVVTKGNPNSHRSVFELQRESKRRKTQETSSSRKPGPSDLSKRVFLEKPIDLTEDDAELVSHISAVADDSDDSLNLGAAERSRVRIAGDGHSTQRLKADHGGGESSKAVDTDTETEAIEEFPVPTMAKGKVGMVRAIARKFEHEGGKPHPPKLPLNSGNPFNPLLPANPKPKVRLFTEEEVVS